MKITKAELPKNSTLKTSGTIYHYVDSFQGEFTSKSQHLEITAIARLFFNSSPKWINTLFNFRNKLVGILGLKTPEGTSRQEKLERFKFEEGDKIGLFKVFSKTNNEIIIGEDDKHLNFRVSLFMDEKTNDTTNEKLIVSTVVKFNNWFGRFYFLPVKPFHKLIVPVMLKEIIKNIEAKDRVLAR